MRLSALLFLSWLLAAWPVPANACSCGSGSGDLVTNLREARDGADAVFHGRVVSVDKPFWDMFMAFLPDRQEATFEVLEHFKGPVASRLALPSGTGTGSCEYPFEPGGEYLVYASEDKGSLVTSLCSRTRPITRDDAELGWLRTGKPPPVPVALQRETVRCQTCDLETVTTPLVGPPPENACNLGLRAPEAAIALRERRPFWTGGYYNRNDPERTTAAGLSWELRPFELIQTRQHGTSDKCRQRVSLRWCERLEASEEPGQARPELRCVNPGPEQELCDETKSRTAFWGPKENLQAAECVWHTPDRPVCKLREELQPLAAEAPASPLLRCSPSTWSARTHLCQVVPGDAAP